MSTLTNCEKCIFADYSDSENPCAIGIIDKIKKSKEIETANNFNKIHHYRCAFAFSGDVYRNNIESIGTIEELKKQLYNRAKIDYYMVILLDNINILDNIYLTLQDMYVKPKFVSFVVKLNNNTDDLIKSMQENMPDSIRWKLHNFLNEYNFQETLDTIFETSTEKNTITYFWINNTNSVQDWKTDIAKINEIIAIEQPFLHAMFRKGTDGLFLTFQNYTSILQIYKTGIIEALDIMENKSIKYYG